MVGMRHRLLSKLPDVVAATLLFGVAAHVRLGRLGAALVNGDSIGPYWKAWTILQGAGWLPRSHAPESGPGLYWLFLPFVAGARSVEEAYARRFVAQALVAPLVFLAVRLVLPSRTDSERAAARLAGLVAGASLVFSAGLRQTLESGYQGYTSIEVCAALVAAFAASTRWGGAAGLGLVLVPLAMMCHPFAAAYLPAAVGVSVVVAYQGSVRVRGAVAAGFVGAVALGVPRLLQLAEPAFDSGSFDLSAVAAIPGGNRTGSSAGATILGSLRGVRDHEGVLGVLLLGAPVVAAAAAVKVRVARAPVAAVAVVASTLAAVGAAIGYLQPYHWRILAPAAAVASCVALGGVLGRAPARWLSVAAGVLGLVVAASGTRAWGPPPPPESDLSRTAALSRLVRERDGSGWVEFGTVGPEMWGSPKAVRMESRFRDGEPPPATGRGPVHLVLAGSPDVLGRIEAVPGGPDVRVVATLPGGPDTSLLVVRLADPRASERWTDDVCSAVAPDRLRIERRAIDYLGFERPELTEAFISMWWDGCTGGNVGW